MAEEAHRKPVKVGVVEGGGPPPGYKLGVEILDQAFGEAMSFLSEDQYEHLAAQFRELARSDDPPHSMMIDVRPVEDFYELRDKGGILLRINVRVFFFVCKPTRTIVVLGTIKKENNGQTSTGTKVTIRRRKRLYLEDRGHGPADAGDRAEERRRRQEGGRNHAG